MEIQINFGRRRRNLKIEKQVILIGKAAGGPLWWLAAGFLRSYMNKGSTISIIIVIRLRSIG
jgi:hypothetical protein